MNTKITVTIITFNEEDFIKECIESAWQIADEIIVMDSYSTDKTVEIAQTLGARVFQQNFRGYGAQKNDATQRATNQWILNLDADERLDEQLIAAIKRLSLETKTEAYRFPRKNHIGARWQRVWYPDYVTRLYNKNRCSFRETLVHESINSTVTEKLPGHIIHYSFKDISDCLSRADQYSKLDAKALFEKRRVVKAWEPALHGAASFFKFYFLKKGLFYGFDGLFASLVGGLRSFLKYAHLLEMQRNHSTSNTVIQVKN